MFSSNLSYLQDFVNQLFFSIFIPFIVILQCHSLTFCFYYKSLHLHSMGLNILKCDVPPFSVFLQNFRPITSGYGSYSRKPSYTPEPQPPQAPQPTYLNNGHSRPSNGHSYGHGNGTGHAQYNNPAGLYAPNGSNGEKFLPNKMSGLNLSATHRWERGLGCGF